MMEGQGQGNVCLEALPQNIRDVHRRLRQAIDKLCVLEDFLLGIQVRDVSPEAKKESLHGVVESCFNNLSKMTESVGEFHDQVCNIMTKLGIPDGPDRIEKG